ncbi:MAG TPA: bifunctional diaminohydroxyphosphoribosylaminopyrimidine deaminase/5-amino-6-(5-phosphoribosylamino)uracil reductase RibD, partial [Burkholderiales bacterium]|nr:bifunctional diaminohydroxyphosphoribosylaminopyrimidine deaminase/5-amino-6-(5-phosphoribosylamino)uracil reductase RibD [Burkholderiales bacterium]
MSAFTAFDHAMMRRALALAEKGLYTATPNPRVGCVLVNGGQVIGEGFHEKTGGPHAEAHALVQASAAARGATAYVTLEPCNHHGKTPPCAQALIKAGVARVVAAMRDPNPGSKQGGAALAAAGIPFEPGLLEEEARELNIGFV